MRRARAIVWALPLLAAGCVQSTQEVDVNPDSGTAWVDRPEVSRVVFHPRAERPVGGTSGFESVAIPVQNAELGARFYAAGTNAPTILFFHGNGEIVADYDDVARVYVQRGIGFFAVDYRGYGRSTGRPTVGTMLDDALVAFDAAEKRVRADGNTAPLFVMGRSLGSASALHIAEARGDRMAGVILDSGFADAAALIKRLGLSFANGAVPKDTLVRQVEKMRAYRGPVLILHGEADFIIPIRDAEALYEAANPETRHFLRVPGAGHNNLMMRAGKRYFDAVTAFVRP